MVRPDAKGVRRNLGADIPLLFEGWALGDYGFDGGGVEFDGSGFLLMACRFARWHKGAGPHNLYMEQMKVA